MKAISLEMARGACTTISSDYKRRTAGRNASSTLNLRGALLMVLTLMLAVAGGWSTWQVKFEEDRLHSLKQQAESMTLMHKKLTEEKKTLLSKKNLEEMGKKMRLHKPDRSQVVVLQ